MIIPDSWYDYIDEQRRKRNEETNLNADGELTEEQQILEEEVERKINEERGT